MRKIFYSVCIAMVSLTFMACPYKSAVPIDTVPKIKVDDRLLGDYEKKGSSTYTYKIERESAKEYKIIQVYTSSTSAKSNRETVYYGYVSSIGGEKYLQTYKKSKYSSTKKYYLYRVKLNASATILTLQPVTENIKEKFETSKELKNYIAKYQDLSFFYEKDEKYYKSE